MFDEDDAPETNVSLTISEKQKGWAVGGGKRFWTPSDVTDKLPAGVYDVGVSSRIGVYLDKKTVVHDNLLNLPSLGGKAILEEISKFWNMRDKFRELGFVHKRGILLHGEPGCGKTSLVNLLIQQIVNEVGGIVLMGDLGGVSMGIQLIRQREPERPIFVPLEDVDGLMAQEQYLLNLLDGANQSDGVVFLATTNYLHKLPPRLVSRPSRFDLIKQIGHPDLTDMTAYVRYVAPPVITNDRCKEIAKHIVDLPMAFVKEMVILCCAYDMTPVDARARLDEIRNNGVIDQLAKAKGFSKKPEPLLESIL